MLKTIAAGLLLAAAQASAPIPPPSAASAGLAAKFKDATAEAVLRRIETGCIEGGLKIRHEGKITLICSISKLDEATDGTLKIDRRALRGPQGVDELVFTTQFEGGDTTVFQQSRQLITRPVNDLLSGPPPDMAHFAAMTATAKAFLTKLGGETQDLNTKSSPWSQPNMAALFKGASPEDVTTKVLKACKQRNFTVRQTDPVTVSCSTTRLIETKDTGFQARLGNDQFPDQMDSFVFVARTVVSDAVVFERSIASRPYLVGGPLSERAAREKVRSDQVTERVKGFLVSLGGEIVPLDAPITKP